MVYESAITSWLVENFIYDSTYRRAFNWNMPHTYDLLTRNDNDKLIIKLRLSRIASVYMIKCTRVCVGGTNDLDQTKGQSGSKKTMLCDW